jgi:hypothetical protein
MSSQDEPMAMDVWLCDMQGDLLYSAQPAASCNAC